MYGQEKKNVKLIGKKLQMNGKKKEIMKKISKDLEVFSWEPYWSY